MDCLQEEPKQRFERIFSCFAEERFNNLHNKFRAADSWKEFFIGPHTIPCKHRKQKPGSGGEHRDPGWLFRAYGEDIRRSGDVPDHTGERITYSPVFTRAQRHGATSRQEQQSC